MSASASAPKSNSLCGLLRKDQMDSRDMDTTLEIMCIISEFVNSESSDFSDNTKFDYVKKQIIRSKKLFSMNLCELKDFVENFTYNTLSNAERLLNHIYDGHVEELELVQVSSFINDPDQKELITQWANANQRIDSIGLEPQNLNKTYGSDAVEFVLKYHYDWAYSDSDS